MFYTVYYGTSDKESEHMIHCVKIYLRSFQWTDSVGVSQGCLFICVWI